MSNTIACGLYDYFEIACMRQYFVSLELHDKDIAEGKAMNLVTQDGKEFIVLSSGECEKKVNLKDIDVLVFVKSGERITIY